MTIAIASAIAIAFESSKYGAASDVLISPEWDVVPFADRPFLFQKVFGMTPMEFIHEYNAPPENAFLSHGYIYANGGQFQVESEKGTLTRDQYERIQAYAKTLAARVPIEIMFVQHDPQTYQLLHERLWYSGTPEGLREYVLGSPNMTSGPNQQFQTPVEYQYVPQKGGRTPEAPSRWTTEHHVEVPVVSRAAQNASMCGGIKFV